MLRDGRTPTDMTLRKKTFSSVRWTAVAAIMKAVLQLLQVAVLARLLAPTEYGLMAMVGVVLTFAALLGDMGLNSAYVQRQQVTDAQRSSLFWVNICISAVLTLTIAAVSPLLAWLLGDSRLTPLLALSGLTCLLGALGQQIRVSAEKSLDFRSVVAIELFSAVGGFLTAVLGSLSDWGVYALVAGNLTTVMLNTIGGWMFLSRGWRPQPRICYADVRPYIGFGGAAMAANLVNQLNVSIDLLLGGRLLGAHQLGLFSVPRSLILQIQFMINPIITRVGFPLIAQMQDDKDRVRIVYLKTMNMSASSNAPVYLAVAFFAPEVVELLLGGHWHGSITFLRILAVWGLIRSTLNPVGILLLGLGRADLSLKWNVVMLLVVSPMLTFGALFGSAGLAWAMLAFVIGAVFPSWRFLVWPLCGARWSSYASACFKPMLLATIGAVCGWVGSVPISLQLPRLILGLSMACVIYWLLSLRFNSEWTSSLKTLVGIGNSSAS